MSHAPSVLSMEQDGSRYFIYAYGNRYEIHSMELNYRSERLGYRYLYDGMERDHYIDQMVLRIFPAPLPPSPPPKPKRRYTDLGLRRPK